MHLPELLEDVMRAARPHVGEGAVASYIPKLAGADPSRFGIAIATNDGPVYGAGDWLVPFSIQSISKAFTLALVLAADGDSIWKRVSREPSSEPFNSLSRLELSHGIPPNPFVNAGALVITDRLRERSGDAASALVAFLQAESENPHVEVDAALAASEGQHGHRNAALAHLLADYGNLHNRVGDVLSDYFRQCSVTMSCRDLAAAGRFLSRGGLRADGSRLLSGSDTKRINTVMLTCGSYDAAGDVAFRVGLPSKSGVGGGILAVVPDRCAICVWSPGLGPAGTSIAGVAALDEFTTRTGWSIF